MYIAFPDQALQEVDHHFSEISGLPVVDEAYRCLGVLSRKDRFKASDVSTYVLFQCGWQGGKLAVISNQCML